ncbi:hypothetical protein RND71_022126 [Anisodus tanguticus]|uniref:DUF4283 domain-containing protein n=1 Tax=Anisodus tanguticus TaxID=243964 RepID=A0AAE1RZF8_9SOLA|nr:hypothetical protein RND71_022126 [Anisodus tanguticus]
MRATKTSFSDLVSLNGGSTSTRSTDLRQLSNGAINPPPTNPDGTKLNFMAAVEGGSKLVRLEHKPMTVVGKFSRIRPQIDRLRDEYKRQVPIRGKVTIGAYDWIHAFMDFTDEEDFKRCCNRRSMTICGMLMRVQRWTRNFKADMESILVPIWVTLPELPWHYHEWASMERILKPLGQLLALDKATLDRTRLTTAKARIDNTEKSGWGRSDRIEKKPEGDAEGWIKVKNHKNNRKMGGFVNNTTEGNTKEIGATNSIQGARQNAPMEQDPDIDVSHMEVAAS